MCVIGTKVGQGHPHDCVCNDSVKPIDLPNMNPVRKFLCVPKEITENYVKPL